MGTPEKGRPMSNGSGLIQTLWSPRMIDITAVQSSPQQPNGFGDLQKEWSHHVPNYVPCNYLWVQCGLIAKNIDLVSGFYLQFPRDPDSIPPESGGTDSGHMLSPEHTDQFLPSHVWIDCFSALLSSNSLLKHNSDPFGAGDSLVFFAFSVLRKQFFIISSISPGRLLPHGAPAWFCNQCWESKLCMNSSALFRRAEAEVRVLRCCVLDSWYHWLKATFIGTPLF